MAADILLATINAKWIHPSPALRLLKVNLGPYETRTEIREFALRQPLHEKLTSILTASPRILGLSVSIWNHRATEELLEHLFEEYHRNPAARPVIILGGPEVSYIPDDAGIMRYADWIVQGEGELVFRDLCALFLARTPGDPAVSAEVLGALPSAAGIQGKRIAAKVLDLEALVSGYRLYTDEDLSRKLVYVESSRGCPFGCEFCLSSRDRQVREFPLEPFLAEMDELIQRGCRSFKFLDRTFNLDPRRACSILEFFLSRIHPPRYVHFEIFPSRIGPELRDLLRRFPPATLRLEVGIQTFNPLTADLIGRPGSPEAALETLRFLRESTNAVVHADLIAGLPGEDLASFVQGFDRLWQVRPQEIQLGILKCLPGAPLSQHTAEYGIRYSPDPPYEALETGTLSKDDLDRIKNAARFWELIVNRGSFPDLVPLLFPEGEPVFARFMALSDQLLQHFGRNWGIARRDLRDALEAARNK